MSKDYESSKDEFQKIVDEEVEKAKYSMMKLLSNGNTLCEFTPSGDFGLGAPLTEEARKKALLEAAEWTEQYRIQQDKETGPGDLVVSCSRACPLPGVH